VAAYIRSVVETIGGQGKPPSIGQAAPSVLVGNAAEGQVYFKAKCAGCHSPTGDLQGVASKIADPKDLQTVWVRGRGGFGFQSSTPDKSNPRAITAAILLPDGKRFEGQLLHVDDFLITVLQADGTVRSFARNGERPKIEIHDPMKMHRDLLTQYTDRDIHDVTAFLATLK
jgi:cytochrome c oxidase cbb3-type subunit 3